MSVRQSLLAAATASIIALTTALAMVPASAQTLRYANQGDLKSLDPYTLNETTTHSHLGQVYEGLIARDKELKIVPGLAESWETPEPTRWRFHLRKGVKFANGDPFTADDVLFSADRARAKGSNVQTRVAADVKVVKVDDYTVDFILTSPNPIFHYQWDTWYIMDKKWAEANNATAPTPAAATTPSFASLNANGTGAFIIESHQPGVKTVFKAEPELVAQGRAQSQGDHLHADRLRRHPRRRTAVGRSRHHRAGSDPGYFARRFQSERPGAEGTRNCAPSSSAWTRPATNCCTRTSRARIPFKDVRVREAFFKAIDIELIKTRVMRGLSTPSALMIAPQLFPLSKDFTRPKFDPDGAKKLLTEAGYPDGFEVTMDCPNDRYVNDAAICQAVVGMLARIGVKVDPAGAAQGAVFRQDPQARRLPVIVLPARLDARHVELAQRAVRHHGLPRRSEIQHAAKPTRRLLQQEAG